MAIFIHFVTDLYAVPSIIAATLLFDNG